MSLTLLASVFWLKSLSIELTALSLQYRTVTQIYDPVTDQWSLGKAHPTYVVYASALATGGVMAPERIYLFGWAYGDMGMISVGDPLYHVQVYDPESDSWVSGAGIPTRRSSFSVAVVDDLFYVIGGSLHTYGEFPIGRTQPPKITYYAANERYTPFGYGTVAPKIEVISPENTTYSSGEVSLVFSVNKPVSWMAYSLSGQEKVVVEGNVTLGGLSEGLHNVTVYAVDMFGNLGASQTISFTVAKPELPEPSSAGLSVPVVAASGATIALLALQAYSTIQKAPSTKVPHHGINDQSAFGKLLKGASLYITLYSFDCLKDIC
jgi:hypothetical protein